MSDNNLVLGIAGSIRNRAGIDDAVEGVDRNVSTETLVKGIEQLEHRDIYHEEFLGEIKPHIQGLTDGNDQVITNSDALTLAALYGAKGAADIEFHKLTSYLGLDESYADMHIDRDRMEPLADALQRADGIVLGTPVYFGDRSSLMHTFLNFAADRDLLQDKVVGTVSCGSKRNGGQETANVYALFESLDHGAYIVGNGPKTCQYGGTGWGGDIGDVATDDFGLETSMGTGLRVSGVAQLRNAAEGAEESRVAEATPDPFTVGVLITRDKNGEVRSSVERTISRIDHAEDVEFNVVDFTESYVQACIGCDVCSDAGEGRGRHRRRKGLQVHHRRRSRRGPMDGGRPPGPPQPANGQRCARDRGLRRRRGRDPRHLPDAARTHAVHPPGRLAAPQPAARSVRRPDTPEVEHVPDEDHDVVDASQHHHQPANHPHVG